MALTEQYHLGRALRPRRFCTSLGATTTSRRHHILLSGHALKAGSHGGSCRPQVSSHSAPGLICVPSAQMCFIHSTLPGHGTDCWTSILARLENVEASKRCKIAARWAMLQMLLTYPFPVLIMCLELVVSRGSNSRTGVCQKI